MYDIYLIRGCGIETMLGITPYEIENSLNSPNHSLNRHEKLPIPPFESEELKGEEKDSRKREKHIVPFGKTEMYLALGCLAFELIVFLMCALLPE